MHEVCPVATTDTTTKAVGTFCLLKTKQTVKLRKEGQKLEFGRGESSHLGGEEGGGSRKGKEGSVPESYEP